MATQETYAAILRLVNPDVNQEFSVSYTLPNTNKPTVFKWNKANGFQTEVPTKITYVDDHKKTVVFRENYALDLINGYGAQKAKKPQLRLLEFVKELKRDVYDGSPFEAVKEPQKQPEQPKEELKSETKSEETKKEKKNEK